MFVLMIVLVVFAKLSAQGNGFFRIPAFVVTWFAVAIIMAASFAVFTSFFWGYPLGWTSRPAPSHSETTNSEPVEKPKAAGEPLNSQQVTKLDSPCCDWLVGRWYGATRRDAENDLQFSSTAHNVLVRKCKYSWADSFVLNVGVRNERKKLMKGVLTYYHAAAEPVCLIWDSSGSIFATLEEPPDPVIKVEQESLRLSFVVIPSEVPSRAQLRFSAAEIKALNMGDEWFVDRQTEAVATATCRDFCSISPIKYTWEGGTLRVELTRR